MSPPLVLVLVAALVLVAIPFVTDMGAAATAGGTTVAPYYILVASGLIATFATVYYAISITKRIFIDDAHGHGHDEHEGEHVSKHARQFILFSGPLFVLGIVGVIGLTLGILPGGIENTWFAEFIRPVVAGTLFPSGGSQVLSFILMGLLVVMIVSSWFTALYLERFKPEMPGLTMLKMKGLYNLVLNRFWLDEFYIRFIVRPLISLGHFLDRLDTNVIDRVAGAPPAATRIRSALLTWEQQYIRARTGDVSFPLAEPSLMRREEAEKELVGMPVNLIDGIAKAGAGASGWVERSLVNRATGFMGGTLEFFSGLVDGIEKYVINQLASLIGGAVEILSGLTSAIEKYVINKTASFTNGIMKIFSGISGGIEKYAIDQTDKLIEGIVKVFAAVFGSVEKRVFTDGVHHGVPVMSSAFGRALLQVENLLGRPAIVGLILVSVAIWLLERDDFRFDHTLHF